MRTGPYTGKKQGAMKAFETALDNIAEKSGENPLQTFVDAICNGAPMEEITRIKFGAVSQPKAVDSSPSRRLDVALRNLAKGAQQGTHKSKRTLTSCIINELTKAASGDVTSFAVSKKEELKESPHLLDDTTDYARILSRRGKKGSFFALLTSQHN